MKKIINFLLLSFFALCIAGALDYRQVIFGNNYEHITEISADTFFEQYPQVKDMPLYANGQPQEMGRNNFELYPFKRVYTQKIGEQTFYRILMSETQISDKQLLDWQNKDTYFDQHVFYELNKSTVLFIGTYTFNRSTGTQFGNFPSYENIEIIQRNNKVIGILAYNVAYYKRWSDDFIITSNAAYVLFANLVLQAKEIQNGLHAATIKVSETIKNGPLYAYELRDVIRIEASTPLIDSTRPFMYTIQNAFDGNPATSYVENTKDDLMKIRLSGYKSAKVAFINGYAQNNATYYNNNRIKTIASDIVIGSVYPSDKLTDLNIHYQLQDDCLTYQIIDFSTNAWLLVADLYLGNKYTDTCIAEIDYFNDEYGWLFGGDYE